MGKLRGELYNNLYQLPIKKEFSAPRRSNGPCTPVGALGVGPRLVVRFVEVVLHSESQNRVCTKFPAPFSPTYDDAHKYLVMSSLTYQEPFSMLAICNRFRLLLFEAIVLTKDSLPTAMHSVQIPSRISRLSPIASAILCS